MKTPALRHSLRPSRRNALKDCISGPGKGFRTMHSIVPASGVLQVQENCLKWFHCQRNGGINALTGDSFITTRTLSSCPLFRGHSMEYSKTINLEQGVMAHLNTNLQHFREKNSTSGGQTFQHSPNMLFQLLLPYLLHYRTYHIRSHDMFP